MNAITLTERAARQVRDYLSEGNSKGGVRLGVRQVGCSGYMYQVEMADRAEPSDVVFESQGIRIIVAKKYLPHLAGTEVDFRREGLKESFHFSNPNAAAVCGCGESFALVSDQTPARKD